MSLDKTDIEKIAHLARLEIDASSLDDYVKDLSNIFDFVEQLSTVDTSTIVPLAHPLETTQRLRKDKITENDQRNHFQAIAPDTENGVYLVPQVIE